MDLCSGAGLCCLLVVPEGAAPEGGCCQVNTLHCTFEGVHIVPEVCSPVLLFREISLFVVSGLYVCIWVIGSYLKVSGLKALIGIYV